MTATIQERPATNAAAAACVAVALGIGVLAAQEKALLALVGVVALVGFLRYPVLGLYVTTTVLLLAGIGTSIGPLQAAVPMSLAKVCAAATAVAWLVNVATHRATVRLGREFVVVGFFLAWALFGVMTSAFWRDQLPEWTRLLTYAGYFVLAVELLDTPKKVQDFTMVVVASVGVMAVYALLQYKLPALQFTSETGLSGVGAGIDKAFVDYEGAGGAAAVRVTGGAGHSNWLALTLLLVLPLNVYWFSKAESTPAKLLALTTVLCELAALVLTFTRLGLVVGLAVALVMIAKRLVRLSPGRVCALLVALVLVWLVLPRAYKERVMTVTAYSESSSTQSRLVLQEHAWSYMEDRPIRGQGIGGFGLRFQEERDTPLAENLRWLTEEYGWHPVHYGPHNLYLQLLCDTGVVGLGLMILLFVGLFLKVRKTQQLVAARGDREALILAGAISVSLISFAFCAIFLHALLQKIWWILAALALAYSQIYGRPEANHTEHPRAAETEAA